MIDEERIIALCWLVIGSVGVVWSLALARRAKNGLSWRQCLIKALQPWRSTFLWSLTVREWALVMLAVAAFERWEFAPPEASWWEVGIRLFLAAATAKAAWDWWRTDPPAATKDTERRDPWLMLSEMSEDNERLRRENAALKGGGA